MAPKPMPTSLGCSDCERRPDVRSSVLGVAAWVGAAAGTSNVVTLWWIGAAAALLGLTFSLIRRWPLGIAIGLILAACLGVSAWRVAAVADGPVARLALDQAVATVELRVGEGRLGGSGPAGPMWVVPVAIERIEGRGQAWVGGPEARLSASGTRVADWRDVAPGARIRVLVKLSPPDDPSVGAWLSPRAAPVLISQPEPVDAAVNAVRAGLRTAVHGLPEAPAALVPAVVVGDTSAMTTALTEQFRATGLTHLTAVSGANLTLLLASVLWVAGRLRVLGWWRRVLALVVVAGFVVLCRGEPSVVRAAAMGVVGLAALGWAGPRQGLRYLSWAVVGLMLLDPWLALSAGFALSVLASGGIVVFAASWTQVLSRWLPLWLAEAIAVPVAAQLVTQPLVTAISGQVSVVGLAANLAAAPLVGPATVLGFAAAGVSVVVPVLAAALAWAAGGFAQVLCWIAEAGNALPGAWLSWPTSPIGVIVLTAACVVLIAAMPWLLARKWVAAAGALLLVAAALRPLSPPGWPPDGWTVVSCDVGQGDATAIRAGPQAAIVIDAGPDARLVARCLDQLEITQVPLLIFTHPHADHIGGIAGVVAGRRVGRVLFPTANPDAAGWRQLRAALAGATITLVSPGWVVVAGQARLTVLAEQNFVAPAVVTAESAEENDSSLILRVEVGGLRMVLAGDVQETGQSAAVAAVSDLGADVLLVPHHGSAHQSTAFLAAVHPQVALISVGVDNDYGHPAARTLTAVQATGARIFRTDQLGAVAVSGIPPGLTVTTQRGG